MKLETVILNDVAWEMLREMQSEKVPCINCLNITNTAQHVDNNGGLAVFTKYVCPHCKYEFMEKDIPRE
jgi:transposase-like protein